jgi:VanZ family protein
MKTRLLNHATIATILLVVFWVGLFLATHLPLPSGAVGKHVSDKVLHFGAYAGLAFLLCWALSSRRTFTISTCVLVVMVAAVYATVDELLQIPIGGRMAEAGDWAADVAGAVCGTLAFALLRAVGSRNRRRSALRDHGAEVGTACRPVDPTVPEAAADAQSF